MRSVMQLRLEVVWSAVVAALGGQRGTMSSGGVSLTYKNWLSLQAPTLTKPPEHIHVRRVARQPSFSSFTAGKSNLVLVA